MEFTTIPILPSFEISLNSTIRNKKSLKIKSQYLSDTGYYMITVSENNKSKPYRVHRLFAETFIPNPKGERYINHKNGIKTDNRIENLEWCSHLENMRHAFKTGLANNTGIKNGMSKLNPTKVRKIKKLLSEGISQHKIASMFKGISRSCILKIKLGKTWKDVS